jgi:two-component system OmpR family sensor kinase
VHIGSRVDGRWIHLWVHDRGAGVPPEDAERIFERFVKGPHRRDGSGLGLSIVSAIAQGHGGYARVAPGTTGGRFEILIPLVTPPAGDASDRRRARAAAG